jgi:hypothetical protein
MEFTSDDILQAAIPGPAVRAVQEWPPVGRSVVWAHIQNLFERFCVTVPSLGSERRDASIQRGKNHFQAAPCLMMFINV